MYYPDDKDFAIYNAKLTDTLSCASEFTFDMPCQNKMYNSLIERKSMVQILRNKKEVFYGEVREIEENIDKTKSVYCVSELAFLFDSIQPQKRFQNETPYGMLEEMLIEHNSQVEERKRFTIGIVTVQDPNNSIYRYTNYEDTLTAIREKLCNTLDGFLRTRKENEIRYLDMVSLKDYGVSANQPIEFGCNLLNYVSKSSTANIATACIPLGAKLETQNVEGLDAYLTIESVNGGKNYVFNQEAVSQFGWVKKIVKFDNVTLPENLMKKGEEWLESNQYKTLCLELKAVDLAELKANIDSYNVGDMIQAIAEPFGMNTWFPLFKKTTYINEPCNNDVILSYSKQLSYTDQISNSNTQLEKEIPETSLILQTARNNASQLIKSAAEGNIFTVYDEDGKAKELLIMDTNDINTAKKVWRWNMNGFGYSSTGYDGAYETAITMDGAIVGERISIKDLYSLKATIGGWIIDESQLRKEDNEKGFMVRFHCPTELGSEGNGNADILVLRTGTKESGYKYPIVISSDGSARYEKLNMNGGGININTANADETVIRILSDASRIDVTSNGFYKYSSDGKFTALTSQGVSAGTYEDTETGINRVNTQYFDVINGIFRLIGQSSPSACGSLVVKNDLTVNGTLYTATGAVSTSDKDLKDLVEELDKKRSAEFVYSLKPSKFKYNNGTSSRFHHGFIAQEVKQSMGNDDWGLYIDKNPKEKGNKALRYEEFIADLVATIQEQNERIIRLEQG